MQSVLFPANDSDLYNQKSRQLSIHDQRIYFKSSEVMAEVPDNQIDVIITSPPYNRKKHYVGDNEEEYNDNIPENEYLAFLKRVWAECFRKASNRCVFFLNIGDSATDQGISEKVAQSMEEEGWIRIQDIIWAKSLYGMGHYTPSGGNRRLNNIWEHIFLFVKNKKEYVLDPKAIGIPYADKGNIGRYGDSDLRDAGNLFHVCYEQTTGATIKKDHDAPFPIGLPYKCIKLVPNAEFILDPFLGTGTTLAAAALLKKKGFGYEKYPQKELIQKTIEQGLNYTPKPAILIPHYEVTIKTLLKIMHGILSEKSLAESKKLGIDLDIMKDTFQKMEIPEKYMNEIKNTLWFH